MKIKFNRDAIDALAKGEAMQRILTDQATGIADRAAASKHHSDLEPEFVVTEPEVQKRRARVAVVTKNWDARHEQAEHSTLLKAVTG